MYEHIKEIDHFFDTSSTLRLSFIVPLWQIGPHQKGTVVQNSALMGNSALLEKRRSKIGPHFGALKKGFMFLVQKKVKMVPSFEGVQFQCPWDTLFVWKRSVPFCQRAPFDGP